MSALGKIDPHDRRAKRSHKRKPGARPTLDAAPRDPDDAPRELYRGPRDLEIDGDLPDEPPPGWGR